ncbi:MAG: hypothetical protein ABIH28_01125 [archaeon]
MSEVEQEVEQKIEEEVEEEIEIMEFSLYGEEIDELIGKLQKLKQTKESIDFDIDEENSLTINYLE